VTDTIVAIATAAGMGGVGIVRISGPAALAIGEALAGKSLDRTVRLARVADDDVIAFAMRAPRSFTGEDVVELQGHGGPVNLGRIVAAVVARGARIAEPGEFTRRAVQNGKLDVARAEALLEVIGAGSERAWRIAQANLAGRLGSLVATIEGRALTVLAELEGWIDFPEQDLEPQSDAWIAAELAALESACAALADTWTTGRALTNGLTVALVGPVNVGKSSLLNALVGTERALVASTPGTTRDWLEVQTVWNGVAVTLIDTAGLRNATDEVERRGIEMGAERVASADVVLVIDDGAPSPAAASTDYGSRALRVRSKADLAPSLAPAVGPALLTSAKTGAGLDELKTRVLELAGVAEREGSEDAVVTTSRQHGLVTEARAAFAAALASWSARRPPELVAIDLRSGATALAQLRGLEVQERVLDELFARFCIGK
jgi:tRNA modification GTPase